MNDAPDGAARADVEVAHFADGDDALIPGTEYDDFVSTLRSGYEPNIQHMDMWIVEHLETVEGVLRTVASDRGSGVGVVAAAAGLESFMLASNECCDRMPLCCSVYAGLPDSVDDDAYSTAVPEDMRRRAAAIAVVSAGTAAGGLTITRHGAPEVYVHPHTPEIAALFYEQAIGSHISEIRATARPGFARPDQREATIARAAELAAFEHADFDWDPDRWRADAHSRLADIAELSPSAPTL